MWEKTWKILLFIIMALVIVGAFQWTTLQRDLQEYTRVLYFHVPTAWITVLAFLMAAWYSILYLRKGDIHYDYYAETANKLGFMFAVLATVTGSIWAKVTWRSFWNWDPRETSIFILLLIYAAYFALRSAIDVQDRRARLSAVYSILAFVTVPFFIFIVPRIYFSLHPDTIINAQGEVQMDFRQRVIFFTSMGSFTVLYLWMFNLRKELAKLKIKLKKLEK